MSISITIGTKKIVLDNETHSVKFHLLLKELETIVIKGCELSIFIFDHNTTNFHKYEFDYLQNSKMSPRQWLLNNILWSITCDETNKNMENMFHELVTSLSYEMKYPFLI